MANNFWFKFYFKEWADDVKPLSLSARGLLVELIIYMRKCDPPGIMPIDFRLISRLTGALSEDITGGLNEFRQYGIFDFEKIGEIEFLKSRKIIKEFNQRLVNQENGKKGGNPLLKPSVNQTKKKSVKPSLKPISDSDFNSEFIFKKNNEKIDLKFIDLKFKKPFFDWIEYKVSRNEMYNTQKSFEAAYGLLLNLSDKDPDKAMLVVQRSTGNNYQGMIPLDKTIKNGKRQENTESIDALHSTSASAAKY